MRAYRITFSHKQSKFVIEVQGFAGMFWSPAKDGSKVRHFDTYEQAVNHVKTIGLDRVYQDFTFRAPFGSQREGHVPPRPILAKSQAYTPRYHDNETLGHVANIPFPTTKEQA